METLYRLKDMLCDELEEYGKTGEITAGTLDVIDKLSHALKSISTIIAMEDADGYSGTEPVYDGRNYMRGRSYRRERRNAMGRYSRDGGYSGAVEDMIDQLREMVHTAPDQQTKDEIQRLISKFSKM